jgi:aspartate/methionine/tyrosine aminotransferase
MKQIISQHASKWESDPDGIYSLAQGVVHWRPPPSMYRALVDAANSNLDTNDASSSFGMDGATGSDGRVIHTYCPDEGYPPLLDALKVKLEKENGISNPHVIVTSGANQAFVNCALTLLDEKDEMGNISKCVVFEPYYFNHVMAIQMTRGGMNSDGSAILSGCMDAKSVEGLLVGPTNRGVPDLAWLRSQLEQYKYKDGGNAIRIVALVNPGNPTGVSLPYSFLEEMKDLTKEFGVWLVMDNTYEHFDVLKKNSLPNAQSTDHPQDFPCFDEEHVINIFSFSKGYSMAGFRVGYISLSSKSNNAGSKGRGTVAYEQMLKVQDTIAICTTRISQMAALGALQAGRSWVYEQVQTLNVGRRLILDAMSGSMEEIIGGDGAMYVMGKLPGRMDDKVRRWSLLH